jgi:hypothetical protein
LREHSIQPMQSFDLVKGKNDTKMALAVFETLQRLWSSYLASCVFKS